MTENELSPAKENVTIGEPQATDTRRQEQHLLERVIALEDRVSALQHPVILPKNGRLEVGPRRSPEPPPPADERGTIGGSDEIWRRMSLPIVFAIIIAFVVGWFARGLAIHLG